jgi:hypothetical protein
MPEAPDRSAPLGRGRDLLGCRAILPRQIDRVLLPRLLPIRLFLLADNR